ncbi:MAG: TonB-dependent receptor [Cyclobacteriaceae bacterium]
MKAFLPIHEPRILLKFFTTFIVLFCQCFLALADIEIGGQVTDEDNGAGLPGVSIFIKGTSRGTVTDVNGDYTIRVPDGNATLVFSFVGYQSKEEVVGSRTSIDVVLSTDVRALEAVIVVGYGTQQRAEVTGAIASISAEQIRDIPVVSFENALQGKVAGVNVSLPSGEPGAAPQIRVRGTGSISAGNDPLYVIDGLPISRNTNLQTGVSQRRSSFSVPKQNPLAALNPNNIASIEVLKDASSAAIYGSRGSNGVVLITTKKGERDGGTQVSFNAYSGIQTVTNAPDLMNSEELIAYTNDSRNNNYLQTYDPLNPASEDYNPQYNPETNAGRPNIDFILIPDKYVNWDGTDTDWLDQIFDPGSIASYNLSLGGGSERFSYYLSGGYYNEKGVVEGSEFDRYTLKTNLTSNLTETLEIGANLNLAFSDNNRLPVNAPYFAQPPGIVYAAMVHSPVIKPYNEDGTPNQTDNQSFLLGGTTTADNPLAIIEAVDESIQNYRTFGNVYAQLTFLEDFTFKTYVGLDIDSYQQSFYRGNSLLYRGASQGDPYGQSSGSLGVNWLWENTLNYAKTIGDHHINGIIGYTAQKQRDELSLVIAQSFPDDQVKTISGGIVTGGNSLQEEWSLASALARFNYSFKERYLLTASIRSDRSSRFGSSNQTGVFPSVSAGWRMSTEPFMADLTFINELKLRASYGVTGNFEIPNYGAIGLLSATNYVLNNQIVNGVGQITLTNENLSWETTRSLDIGLDVAFLDDRIYGSIDYYVSRTSDLLLNVTIPSSSGFETALTNIGEVENKGIEFSITSRNLTGAFQWSTDLNFAANKNKVLRLGPAGDPILSVGAAGLRHITRIGDPIGSYYGYVVDGIYQSQAEIDAAPTDELAPDPQPGDIRFKDVNGDGTITSDDRTVTGSYFPDFTYGITNRFRYKQFDLSVFIQGVEGREVLNLTQRHLLNGEANFNSYAIMNERWISAENPGNGELPRADRNSAIHGNNFRESSFQVEDGSYLRLRNVTLGYNFPAISKFISQLRVYVSGTNLFMKTDYLGFNPEVNLQPDNSLTPGEDYGAYPLAKIYTLGVDISF